MKRATIFLFAGLLGLLAYRYGDALDVRLNHILSALNVDGGTLYVDPTNNRVGVGTTSPGANLEIISNAGTTNPIIVRNSDNSNRKLFQIASNANEGVVSLYDASDVLAIRLNGGTGQKSFINGGNVGIGTTDPGQKLQIQDGIILSSTTSGFGRIHAYGSSGGCLMFRDTDNAGWTECVALNGTMSCASDADGVCDGT